MANPFLEGLGILPNPLGALQQGMENAEDRQYLNTMRQAQIDEIKAKVEAAKAAKAAKEAQQAQWNEAVQTAMQAPSAEAFARLHLINPEASTAIKEAWGSLDKQRQASDLQEMSAIRGLLAAGRPELARERLQARIEADRAAGQDTADDEEVLALIDRDPSAARFMVDYALSSIAGPEKFGQMLGELGGEARAQELHPSAVRKAEADATKAGVDAEYAEPKAQAELADTRSQMAYRNAMAGVAWKNAQTAADRLGLDRERLEADIASAIDKQYAKATEITPGAEKLMNEAVIAAQAAKSSAGRLTDLADRFAASNISGVGGFSALKEFAKGVTGFEDGVSALRQQYQELRASQIVKNLPPGAASDADIAMAMKGWPSPNADKNHLVRFLRGMAKLQELDAASATSRADWIAENGNLGRSKREIMVNGTLVPPGTTFSEFMASDAATRSMSGPSAVVEGLLEKYAR